MKISHLVNKYDPLNQFDVLVNSFQQIKGTLNVSPNLSSINFSEVTSVILAGMGGSAIGGDLAHDLFWDDLNIPFIVHRNYGLPNFADENTLLIASSYSGNTEETLSALNKGLERNCKIICMSTGGEVESISANNNLPFVRMASGYQPRYALWINFFTLLNILQIAKLIPNQSGLVQQSISLLKEKGVEFAKENNKAYKTAESLIGFIPLIYSAADSTAAVGNRLKCQFNENSKIHSFFNVLPELNHNEIIGWETFNISQFACKTILINDDYNPRIKKRIEVTAEVLTDANAEIIELKSEQKEFKQRLIDLIYFGDWISYYLAILRGFDPSEINNINYLKNRLADTNP